MSTSKFQMTAFSRLIIALLFIVPISYFAASYYTGEDGHEEIKEIFGTEEKKEDCTAKIKQLEKNVQERDQVIEELKREVQSLEQSLADEEKNSQ